MEDAIPMFPVPIWRIVRILSILGHQETLHGGTSDPNEVQKCWISSVNAIFLPMIGVPKILLSVAGHFHDLWSSNVKCGTTKQSGTLKKGCLAGCKRCKRSSAPASCIMIGPRPGMAESVRIIIYGCDTSNSSTRRKRFLFVVLLI